MMSAAAARSFAAGVPVLRGATEEEQRVERAHDWAIVDLCMEREERIRRRLQCVAVDKRREEARKTRVMRAPAAPWDSSTRVVPVRRFSRCDVIRNRLQSERFRDERAQGQAWTPRRRISGAMRRRQFGSSDEGTEESGEEERCAKQRRGRPRKATLAEEEGDRMSRAWRRMQRSIPQLATVPVPFELAAKTLKRSREASHVVEGSIEVSGLERGEHMWRECRDDAGAMRFGRRAKGEDAEKVLVGNWAGHADIGMGLSLYGSATPGRERNVRSRDVRRLRTAMQVRHSLTIDGARAYLFVCVCVAGAAECARAWGDCKCRQRGGGESATTLAWGLTCHVTWGACIFSGIIARRGGSQSASCSQRSRELCHRTGRQTCCSEHRINAAGIDRRQSKNADS